MTPGVIKSIALENLRVDLFNPRHVPQSSQREALATIALEQGFKLVNLAEDIADKGLNPSDPLLVTPDDEEGIYTVLEGNRRVAAMKLMASMNLLASIGLPGNLYKRFKVLHDNAASSLPSTITCVVLDREDANHWILLKHTGEADGVGVVMWDGRSRQRFRGSSPALQAIERVEESNLIDEETKDKLPKISITNVERLLSTPEVRKMLGVDVGLGDILE